MTIGSFWRNPGLRVGVAISGLFGLVASLTIWGLPGLLPRSVEPQRLPDPNGYVDLIRAGGMIDGSRLEGGEWRKADLGDLRKFVDANKAALELTRIGLSREGLASFSDSHAGLDLQVEQTSKIRWLSRLMLADARIAEEEGRFGDAARLDFEILEVGQMTTQGALAIGVTVGWALQFQAIEQLRKLRDHLPPQEMRPMIRRLERLDQRRIPLEPLVDRELQWGASVVPLWPRLMMSWSGMQTKTRLDATKSFGELRDRVGRKIRFLMIDWAIHVHHEETGRWPRTVAEMVPSILTARPVDPATKQPLIYPVNASGELTNDLSMIGQADGATVAAPRP